MNTRSELRSRTLALIKEPTTPQTAVRDALIEDIADWQRGRIAEYARLSSEGRWPPALPTDVFRFRRIAAHSALDDVRVFQSSGTTSSDRSTHVFCDLSLYDAAARAAAQCMLFPDVERMRIVFLAPHEREAPHSSLSYMLSRFEEWFGVDAVWAWTDGTLDLARLERALRTAERAREPVALLGTSFAFVHAEDGLDQSWFTLPHGSRIMQTGGYKGRSREVEPAVLRNMMRVRYGIPEPWIIAEYGMTELSSQMYETTLRNAVEGSASQRCLWAPPWVRVTAVDPDTLLPVEGGATGVLRIDDCANLDSVCCILSADVARKVGEGVVIEGRSAGAVARGCSLAADQALRGR